MAASYPGAVKTFSAVVNGVTKLVASLFNSPYDEITAIETELGTDVAGSLTDLKTRLAVHLNDNGTPKNIIGAMTDKSADYGAQIAATDLLIIVNAYVDTSTNLATVIGYTDSAANPTTAYCQMDLRYPGASYEPMQSGTFTMPVKKGNYWKVVKTGSGALTALTVYSVAIGS